MTPAGALELAAPKKWGRRGLRARIVGLVAVGLLLPVGALFAVGQAALARLRSQIVEDRRVLAQSLADHLDALVRSHLELLQDLASRARPPDTDPAALRDALLGSHLLSSVFVLDARLQPVAAEPAGLALPPGLRAAAERAFAAGRPAASDLVEERLYLFVPVRDYQGRAAGLAGGEIDPRAARFAAALQLVRVGEHGSTDLVDSRGRLIAGTVAARTARGAPREVLVRATLKLAPWEVRVREDEAEAFAGATALAARALWVLPVLLAVAVLFAWGAARSVIRPLAVLGEAARRITAGDLSHPIPPLGEDEVGALGRALERMRGAVERTNAELEQRVAARTRELQSLYEELRGRDALRGRLLRKVITAQEAERKRIARELHDEAGQTLAALAMGLQALLPALPEGEARAKVEEARALAVRTLDQVHRLIFDLRPSVLDDLGLASAIRWTAERHLEPRGVVVHCEFTGLERRLPPEVETTMYRVAQEAIANIGRHAEAESVQIELTRSEYDLTLEIEDDGQGFDPASVARPPGSGDDARGLGLLGVRERVELLGGTAAVESSPGQGTRLVVRVPLVGNHGR